jgi:hypothetical protein
MPGTMAGSLFERGVIVIYETIRCWCDNSARALLTG